MTGLRDYAARNEEITNKTYASSQVLFEGADLEETDAKRTNI